MSIGRPTSVGCKRELREKLCARNLTTLTSSWEHCTRKVRGSGLLSRNRHPCGLGWSRFLLKNKSSRPKAQETAGQIGFFTVAALCNEAGKHDQYPWKAFLYA